MARPCLTDDGRPKRRYLTRGEAFARVEPVSRLSADGRVEEYQCPECGYWHIGHARKARPEGESTMTTAWKDGEIFLGMHHKVQVGFTPTEDGPLWSVDINTDVDGIWINGCGPTLVEAAEKAAEVAQAAAKPFVETD